MSIQDVLDEAGRLQGRLLPLLRFEGRPARGVIDRMVDAAIASVQPFVDDPDSRPRKLEICSAASPRARPSGRSCCWRSSRSGSPTTTPWFARSSGAVVIARLTPLLAAIIRAGPREGVFAGHEPDDTARVFVSLMQGAQRVATELFVARQAGTIAFDDVVRTLAAHARGVRAGPRRAPGSLPLIDESALDEWFD